jgi:hypothetical protein
MVGNAGRNNLRMAAKSSISREQVKKPVPRHCNYELYWDQDYCLPKTDDRVEGSGPLGGS